MRAAEFQSDALRVIALYRACVEARRANPLYDGDSAKDCRIIREPAGRHPDTKKTEKKEFSFTMWMTRQPGLSRAAFDLLIAPADMWELASGKLSVEEVEALGIRRFPLIEED